MADGMWLSGADISALVGFAGQAAGLGVGLAVSFFISGWAIAFIVDLFRGLL